MDTNRLERTSENEWWIELSGEMRVPAIIYATESLVRETDERVYEQVTNVAALPGIVTAYAMPDAHWGYGFPIGGGAAFGPERGGVFSAGGVGFDISCRPAARKRWRARELIDTLARGEASLIRAHSPVLGAFDRRPGVLPRSAQG